MRARTWCGVGLLLLCAAPCGAAGYDHYSVAMAAENRGDDDLAISEFTAALAAGDLNAGLLPTAYLQRGGIYLSRHDCAHAAADTASALQFKPDDREALALQARVHECLGNYPAAISDYQALAALSPNGIIFREEAIAYWITGDFAGAEKPLMQAVAIEPTSAYVALWLAVMRARAGDTAQPPAAKFDEDEWPGPVFALYAGKTTPQAVMAAAGKGSAADVIGHTCEANFYLAEWWLAQKQSATAWPLLAEANAKCPKDFIEHKLAVLELTHPHLENP